jgi:hypothetical protein
VGEYPRMVRRVPESVKPETLRRAPSPRRMPIHAAGGLPGSGFAEKCRSSGIRFRASGRGSRPRPASPKSILLRAVRTDSGSVAGSPLEELRVPLFSPSGPRCGSHAGSLRGNMLPMRTTIRVDDRLGTAARARARQEGLTLSALVARALEEHLAQQSGGGDLPFRLVVVGGGGVFPGIDLDRTSELLVSEDLAVLQRSGSKAS